MLPFNSIHSKHYGTLGQDGGRFHKRVNNIFGNDIIIKTMEIMDVVT